MLAPSMKAPAEMGTGCGDEAVQATNDDAGSCKRCAVHLGYWDDPHLPSFIRGPVQRKSPEINRGYFARTYGVFNLIKKALKQFSELKIGDSSGDDVVQVQIVNLGAGYDTLYWRLMKHEDFPANIKISTFVDIDFRATAKKKIQYLVASPDLMSVISTEDSEIKRNQTELHSCHYHIVGADIRDKKELESRLLNCGIVGHLPTIFVSECVLVYLDAISSENMLQFLSRTFTTSVFINYEQANMNDNFAQIMLKNLQMRGCQLSGVAHCKSIESQITRFVSTGWTRAYGWTMTEVYNKIPSSEISRIEKIEMLDERELLKQLLDHYCIVVALNYDRNILQSVEL